MTSGFCSLQSHVWRGTQWMFKGRKQPIWSLMYSDFLRLFCVFVLAFVLLEVCQRRITLLSVFYKKEASPSTLPKWPPILNSGSVNQNSGPANSLLGLPNFLVSYFYSPTTHSCCPLLGYPKVFLHVPSLELPVSLSDAPHLAQPPASLSSARERSWLSHE